VNERGQSLLSLPASQSTSQPSECRARAEGSVLSSGDLDSDRASDSVFSLMSGTQLAARLVRNSQNWPFNITNNLAE